MSYSTADFPALSPLQQVVIDQIRTLSAVQKLAKRTEINGAGAQITNVSTGGVKATDEAGKKLLIDGETETKTLLVQKFSGTIVWTDELDSDVDGAIEALVAKASEAIAFGIDEAVFVDGVSAGKIPKLTVAGTEVVEVSDWRSFSKAIQGVNGNKATGIALNQALLSELQMVVNEKTGTPALNIVITESLNGLPVSGTIQNIQFEVIAQSKSTESSDPVGYIGPWGRKAYWGVVPGSLRIEPITGAYYDADGVVKLLDASNQRGIVVEIRFGFYADQTDFTRVDVVEAPVTPEA